MYNTAPSGASYSTPSSPNQYAMQSTEGKPTYDRALTALFRSTAANVTQLYKEASDIGQAGYKAGYEQCFDDILEFVIAAGSTGTPGETQNTAAQLLMEFARQKRISPQNTRFPFNDTHNTLPTTVQSRYDNNSNQAQRLGDEADEADEGPTTDLEQKHLKVSHSDTKALSNNFTGSKSTESHASHGSNSLDPIQAIESNKHTSGIPCIGDGCCAQKQTDLSAMHDDGNSAALQTKPKDTDQNSMHISHGPWEQRQKRALEPIEIMDIEPPRQRQRLDNMETL